MCRGDPLRLYEFHRVAAGKLRGNPGGAMPSPNTDTMITTVIHPFHLLHSSRSTHRCPTLGPPTVMGHLKPLEAVPPVFLDC